MKILIACDGSSCADSALEDMRLAMNGSGWAACPPLPLLARIARSRPCDPNGGQSEDSSNK
jgi:hypothetical protein